MPDQVIAGPMGPLPTYVARPPGQEPRPGVVVIHDAVGMGADVRRQADWLAGAGYLAAAPDLFSRGGGPIRCLRQIMRETRQGAGRSFDEIEAVRGWLKEQLPDRRQLRAEGPEPAGCDGTPGAVPDGTRRGA